MAVTIPAYPDPVPASTQRPAPRYRGSTYRGYTGPVYGRWKAPNARTLPKIKAAKRKKMGLLFVDTPGAGGTWIARRKPPRVARPRSPGGSGAPTAPAAPPDPLAALRAQYPGYPDWALRQVQQINAEQAAHQNYVTGQVAPWLASALERTGAVGMGLERGFVQDTSGAASIMGTAAAARPTMIQSGTPGGLVYSPTSYESDALSGQMQAQANLTAQQAQIDARMGVLENRTQSQAYIAALADYARGLPTQYVERRRQATEAIDKYLADLELEKAKLAETERSNKVDEGIRFMNAQAGILQGYARLGLDAQELANDMAQQPGSTPTSLPPGFVAVPTDDGGYEIRSDPSYVPPAGADGSSPSTSTRAAGGKQFNMGPWPSKPKKIPRGVVVWQGSDGKWYGKRTAASGGGQTPSSMRAALSGAQSAAVGFLTVAPGVTGGPRKPANFAGAVPFFRTNPKPGEAKIDKPANPAAYKAWANRIRSWASNWQKAGLTQAQITKLLYQVSADGFRIFRADTYERTGVDVGRFI